VAQGNMEKQRRKKTRATVQNKYQSNAKRMLKTNLQPSKQKLYQVKPSTF
jgi:hypothetical protein